MMQHTHVIEDLEKLQRCYFQKTIKEDAVQLLSGGYSLARNYRIGDAGKTYLARFMPAKQSSLATREKECFLTTYAGKIGIGPKVYYQDPQQGIIITEFIHGRTADYNDMVNEPYRKKIIAKIKKLHQSIPSDFPKANSLSIRIQKTFERTGSTILSLLGKLELMEPLQDLFDCEENNLTPALIHGDLVPDNILIDKGNRVYFIDWTDAGIGDPFSDISWHALFFPQSLHKDLLKNYFEHIDATKQQKLLCYYCLRLFLLTVWGIEHAKKFSKNCEQLLIDRMNQPDLSEPDYLMKYFFTNKIPLKGHHDFLLISATMLHFLSRFTKTDAFFSAIKELGRHA